MTLVPYQDYMVNMMFGAEFYTDEDPVDDFYENIPLFQLIGATIVFPDQW